MKEWYDIVNTGKKGSMDMTSEPNIDITGALTAGIRLCPAIAFDRIVGGRYKLRILWTLNTGTKRYGVHTLVALAAMLGTTPKKLLEGADSW